MKKLLLTMLGVIMLVGSVITLQAQTVVTSYAEKFTNPVDLTLWTPNGAKHVDNTPAFDVSQSNGTLHVDVNQVNFWDGQGYNFKAKENIIIDMTANPFVSFDLKIEQGATYDSMAVDSVWLLVSPFAPNDTTGAMSRQVAAVKMLLPADGLWHNYTYDIGSNLGELEWNGDVLENDLSKIEVILLESAIWPAKYVYSYEMDNFKIGDAAGPAAVVTSYSERFNAPVDLDDWRPNKKAHDDGSPVFDVTQANNALHVDLNQKNFWDGQGYNFKKNDNIIIDMSANPFITFDLKIEAGATFDTTVVDSVWLLVSPFAPNDTTGVMSRQVAAVKKLLPADGAWHTYRYDIGANLGELEWNGDVLENDLTKIQVILLESAIWPSNYKYSYDMDNFKVGDAAGPPTVVTSYKEDFNNPLDLELWTPNGKKHDDESPVFNVSQSGGSLNVDLKQKNFWDGQGYNFTKTNNIIIDMSADPFVSFDMKIDKGATFDTMVVDSVWLLVSPFAPNDTTGVMSRQVAAVKMKLPADGAWHSYTYDIGANLGELEWNGDVLENDLTKIEIILLESAIWPSNYSYSYQMDNFAVGSANITGPTVVTSYQEDFNNPADLSLWTPNAKAHDDGSPVFNVSQSNDVLKVGLNQKNFWDGQGYNFRAKENIIIDMSADPFVTFDMKIAKGAVYDTSVVDSVWVLVSPFAPNDTTGVMSRQVAAVKKLMPADGAWHSYSYDIGAKLGELEWNGDVLENDLTKIQVILVESAIWPSNYAFDYQLDNFAVGSANISGPSVITSYEEDFESDVDLNFWTPNGKAHDDGSPVFGVSQADGALHVDLNQKNFWDGQGYNFRAGENKIIDMTANPYISFKLRVQPGAVYDTMTVDSVWVLVSPFAPNDTTGVMSRQVAAVKKLIPADGRWHFYQYDIGANLGELEWNGDVLENDLSKIEVILVESAIWPSNYKFTYDMEYFRIGDAAEAIDPGEPLITHQVPQVDNKFWAQWKVNPTHAPMNGATGLSMGAVEAWGDFGAILRFNPDGFIDAYDGTISGYSAENAMAYEKDVTYTIEMVGDVSTGTYSVKVKPQGLDWIEIGTDFAFRSNTPQTSLNFFNMKIEENTAWGGLPGARLRPSFEFDDYILGFYNQNAKGLAMETEHEVHFTALPTANGLNTAFATSKDEPGLLAWGELSTIIRFNAQDKIDVRNGTGYEALEDFTYTAGQEYQVSMTINVPSKTYSVSVSDGGDPVTIATDYAFRADADILNYAIKQNLIGGDFGGKEGDLLISNIEVTTVGNEDLDLPQFNFYPNPTQDYLTITTGELASEIKITSLSGSVLKTISTHKNSKETISVSDLSSGAYILSIYANDVHSSKLFIKK